MRTGDVGEWRDGNLKLIDRARDFLVTSGGKTISPSFIENILRASPFIAEAIVFGHGRKYLTALIEIDFDTVADWARTQRRRLHRLHQPGAEPARGRAQSGTRSTRPTRSSRASSRSRRSASCPRCSIPEEEGEPVTPTRKVKRSQMYERFKALVEEHVRRQGGETARRKRDRRAGLNVAQERNEVIHGRKTMLRKLAAAAFAATVLAAPAAAQDTYTIGLTGALTGPPASTYAPAVEALRIYIERVNAAGGINGKKVNLILQDDSAEPGKAAANAKKLITQDNVILMLNASLSSTYAPVVAEAKRANVPVLFASSVCPKDVYPPADPLQFCTTAFAANYDSRAALAFIKETAKEPVKIGLSAMAIPISRGEMDFAEQQAPSHRHDRRWTRR